MANKIKVGKYFELSGAWVAIILLLGKFIFAMTAVSIFTENGIFAYLFVGLRECYSMFKGWLDEGKQISNVPMNQPEENPENKV
jgi:hypothetical protein